MPILAEIGVFLLHGWLGSVFQAARGILGIEMNAQPTAVQIFKAFGALIVPGNWLGQGGETCSAIPTS
jgi:hypothetical protein